MRNNLAEAYRAGGRTGDARREFETILAANPTYAPAHYGLALVYDAGLAGAPLAATLGGELVPGDREAKNRLRRLLEAAP